MTAGYTWNDSSSAGRGRLLEPEQPQLGEAEVSSESSCALLPFGKSAEVIELSSDSECDSSENASLDSTTDQDDGIDLDPDDSGDDAPAGSQDRFWTTLWPGMTRQRSFMSAVKVTISITPAVEREHRMAQVRNPLMGVVVERQLEPSHELLEAMTQQKKANQLTIAQLERCTSREWEITMARARNSCCWILRSWR
jgi:hypothetical protein